MRKNAPTRTRRSWPLGLLAGTSATLCAAGCESPVDAPTAEAGGCYPDGSLSTTLHGAIAADIRWGADGITCQGMPRPEGEGARLRLSAPLSDAEPDRTIAFILGIPGLQRGETGTELPTNVTLIEEGAGRFFATRDTSGCWTDVAEQAEVGGSLYAIRGTVYCVSPLPELNGGSSISFTELDFSGRIDWSQTQ